MANRRISDLQELAGIDLADQDLFTVVRVGEVDPELKNKKLTISGTKQYLNTYYLPSSGGTITGNTLINGNLNVSGLTTLSGLAVNNQASVSGLIVQNNATVSGVISGSTFTGNTIHGTNINGTTITATTLSVIGSGNVASGLSAQYFNLNTTGVATNVTNGLFAPTGNTVGFSVNAVERARINSLGREVLIQLLWQAWLISQAILLLVMLIWLMPAMLIFFFWFLVKTLVQMDYLLV